MKRRIKPLYVVPTAEAQDDLQSAWQARAAARDRMRIHLSEPDPELAADAAEAFRLAIALEGKHPARAVRDFYSAVGALPALEAVSLEELAALPRRLFMGAYDVQLAERVS